jgi:hypothetical protein
VTSPKVAGDGTSLREDQLGDDERVPADGSSVLLMVGEELPPRAVQRSAIWHYPAAVGAADVPLTWASAHNGTVTCWAPSAHFKRAARVSGIPLLPLGVRATASVWFTVISPNWKASAEATM